MGTRLHMAAAPPSDTDESAVLFVDHRAVTAMVDVLHEIVHERLFVLEAPPGDVVSPLALLRLVCTECGPLRVDVRGNELVLVGAQASFRGLADELAEFAAQNDLEEPGMHAHFDRSQDPPPSWIADESLPLVVAGWVSDAT